MQKAVEPSDMSEDLHRINVWKFMTVKATTTMEVEHGSMHNRFTGFFGVILQDFSDSLECSSFFF